MWEMQSKSGVLISTNEEGSLAGVPQSSSPVLRGVGCGGAARGNHRRLHPQ